MQGQWYDFLRMVSLFWQKTLIRLCGCAGWSESSLGAQVIIFRFTCCGSNGLTENDLDVRHVITENKTLPRAAFDHTSLLRQKPYHHHHYHFYFHLLVELKSIIDYTYYIWLHSNRMASERRASSKSVIYLMRPMFNLISFFFFFFFK